MRITVTGVLIFKQLLGGQNLVVDMAQGTLADLLNLLCERYGRSLEKQLFEEPVRKLKATNLIMLNDRPLRHVQDELNNDLRDGDHIRLSPIVAGG